MPLVNSLCSLDVMAIFTWPAEKDRNSAAESNVGMLQVARNGEERAELKCPFRDLQGSNQQHRRSSSRTRDEYKDDTGDIDRWTLDLFLLTPKKKE